jgi:hypothetical protein
VWAPADGDDGHGRLPGGTARNTITGNSLCAQSSTIYLFDGEQRRRDNAISGNSCSGSTVDPILAGGPIGGSAPLDPEKIANDIAVMRGNGLNDSAIRYVFGLDDIEVPDTVLLGQKTTQDAITDGSLKQGTAPTTWTLPTMTPQGSSASSWTPNVSVPTIDQLRSSITSRTRPPNC